MEETLLLCRGRERRLTGFIDPHPLFSTTTPAQIAGQARAGQECHDD
jgi:hypothetical protein